ncbi:hypothetical protein M2262_003159 [Pseudomonas sp. BIGb0408]|uniref:Tyr recombinase domain-containing protein n=1 Tax=Phytopseudomonas flavescens TaxID=29435 RepID=A0A7Z0BPP3_9GAMM|nr:MULTISPECIES: tyrosine-type recombinase/integrase [Pseudomonas]MCW2293109.1 hypothetical protein [Pseudomonas sp. BIGb0408]NYH72321.1 hypothetical protein [Pseudomonas flavescens]
MSNYKFQAEEVVEQSGSSVHENAAKPKLSIFEMLALPKSERANYKPRLASLPEKEGLVQSESSVQPTKTTNQTRNEGSATSASALPDDVKDGSDEDAESVDGDDESEAASMLREIEEDYSELEFEELESLQEEFQRRPDAPSSSLASKLSVLDDFPICPESNYRDKMWKLPHGKNSFANNIRFNRELSGSNDLKRVLVYHVIPDYSPFSFIRSYTTAKAFGNEYAVLEKYIFIDNHISAQPEHIALISIPMVMQALEKAKASESKLHFFLLFKFLRLWCNLSEHKLIPEQYYLSIPIDQIDTVERRHEVLKSKFTGTMNAWTSYSEEDLEHIMNYATAWLDGAIPKLSDLKNYIMDNGFHEYTDKNIKRRERLIELDKLMTITIDGKEIMRPHVLRYTLKGDETYTHSWVGGYGRALNGIRNSIFMLVALVTGGRKSELATIHFDHITTDHKGDYWITITRYKTSASPTHGEEDTLPLPRYVGDMISKFKELRSLPPFYKQGWLFQPNNSSKVVNKATPGLVTNIIVQLKEELPIARLHAHRFRKTIAEILINRDERNIDIIRALFGHKSYAMTLRYIARNPLMVRSVAIAIEQSYAREFHDIVAGIRFAGYSGEGAKRIYQQILKRPDEFTGKQLKVTLVAYVSHLLAAGEPLFIRRTAVGTYCLTGEHFTHENLPPCLQGREIEGDLIMPDPGNCQPDCRKIVVLQSAKYALEDTAQFYSQVLNNSAGKLSAVAERELNRRVKAAHAHLANLNETGHSAAQLIEVTHA